MVQIYTLINMRDVTDVVAPDNEDNGSAQSGGISFSASLSDPASTWDFVVDDVNQTINVQNFQPVIIFDENAPSIAGVATVPSMNFSVGQSYVAAGALSAIISFHLFFNNPAATWTFSNNAVGVGTAQQTTLLGYVQPGVSYMFSAYLDCTTPLVNAQAYLQVNWLDINSVVISSISQTYPSTHPQVRENISGVAPAGTVYAQLILGGQTTNATNSGVMKWSSPQFEPMWFTNKGVSYPTPDCNATQVNSVVMPDGTYSRKCRLFAGYVEDYKNFYVAKQRHTAVQCASSSKLLETAGLISASYTNTLDSSVLSNALSLLPANANIIGQLATGQQNQFSPSSTLIAGVTVDSISFNNATPREVANGLIAQSGSIVFVDPYYYLWYVPPSFVGTTVMLSDNPDGITSFSYDDFNIEYDSTNPVNVARVQGSKQNAAAITDPFSGDGSTTVFNLNFPPHTVTSVTVGGTGQRTGVDGVDNAKFGSSLTYKALINKQKATIQFATAPASGSNNILVTYTYEDQVISDVYAADAIADANGFQAWGMISDSNITSTVAAKNRGLKELTDYSSPRTILTLSSLGIYLPVGSLILFTNQSEGMTNAPFIVQTVDSDILGGGVYHWNYTAGVYNPTLLDHVRNVSKAVKKTPTTANVVVIASIDVALFDGFVINDSVTVNASGAPPQGPYLYGGPIPFSTDSFTRANQAGFGTASDGESYFQVAGTDLLSISSNKGVVTNNGSGASNRILLGVTSATDAEGLVRITIGDYVNDPSGILLRCDNTGANQYLGRFTPGSTTQIEIDKRVAGTLSAIATFTSGITIGNGSVVWIKFRAQGTTLSIKMWLDGTGEPANFAGSTTDATFASGRYGLYCAGAPTTPEKFDSLTINNLITGAKYGFASYS